VEHVSPAGRENHEAPVNALVTVPFGILQALENNNTWRSVLLQADSSQSVVNAWIDHTYHKDDAIVDFRQDLFAVEQQLPGTIPGLPLVNQAGTNASDLWLPDGIHPGTALQGLWAKWIVEAINAKIADANTNPMPSNWKNAPAVTPYTYAQIATDAQHPPLIQT
jgi:hypothetical protein